jgi:hypothetical protein
MEFSFLSVMIVVMCIEYVAIAGIMALSSKNDQVVGKKAKDLKKLVDNASHLFTGSLVAYVVSQFFSLNLGIDFYVIMLFQLAAAVVILWAVFSFGGSLYRLMQLGLGFRAAPAAGSSAQNAAFGAAAGSTDGRKAAEQAGAKQEATAEKH